MTAPQPRRFSLTADQEVSALAVAHHSDVGGRVPGSGRDRRAFCARRCSAHARELWDYVTEPSRLRREHVLPGIVGPRGPSMRKPVRKIVCLQNSCRKAHSSEYPNDRPILTNSTRSNALRDCKRIFATTRRSEFAFKDTTTTFKLIETMHDGRASARPLASSR